MTGKESRRLLYALKDKEMRGGLDKYLRQAREQGKSYVVMAAELSKKGTPVGKSTIHDWLNK